MFWYHFYFLYKCTETALKKASRMKTEEDQGSEPTGLHTPLIGEYFPPFYCKTDIVPPLLSVHY